MIFLALRYLFSRRRQTLLTLLGILLGSAAYVAISGFMLGFREYLVDQLVNNSAHIHIQSRDDYLEEHSLDIPFYPKGIDHVFWLSPPSGQKGSVRIENPESWYARLRDDPRVLAYAPQLKTNVLFTDKKTNVTAVLIGCDPVRQTQIATLSNYMIEGKFSDIGSGGNRIVIGSEIQRKMGLKLFQNVFVVSSRGDAIPFKVVGVFKTGNKLGDLNAYGSLGDVQRVNGSPNRLNEIGVRLRDHTLASKIANDWTVLAGENGGEKIESWDQQNASLFDVFKVQDAVRYLSIGSILVVAAFGIYNVLNMTVMQKRKDIAILRSLGFSPADVVWLFFSQGLILGITGAGMGLLLGYGLCVYLQTLPFSGGPMGSGSGHMMVSLNPSIYIQGGFLAVFSSTLASVLPAREAGKMTPIGIIREGAE